MKLKRNLAICASAAIILAAYCVAVLILPLPKNASFWTAFAFTLVALLLTTGVGVLTFWKPESMTTRFLKTSPLYVSCTYAFLQLAWGIAVISVPIHSAISASVSVVLLGVCLSIVIILPTATEAIVQTEKTIHKKTFYLKELQADLEQKTLHCPNPVLKQRIKALADETRYSDPMSADSLVDLELEIRRILREIDSLMYTDVSRAESLCKRLHELLAERNLKCKLLKQ